MKPDVAESGGSGDSSSTSSSVNEPDVEPCDLFVSLGMLVLESRLPTPSVKGRRDGPHCPPALGLQWTSHTCDLGQPQCERAARIQKQMQMLWRNRIPMCIEVLLFASCRHGQARAASVDIAPPDVSDSCILLEQWTIQSVARKSSEQCVSPRSLFQAIRSHLHFSQLSAWLNATHGMAPQCIGYRVSPPGEFCTNRFSVTPEHHVFPMSSMGKSSSLRTTVQLLPRLSEIPKPLCHDSHDLDGLLLASCTNSSRHSFNEPSKCSGRLKSPDLSGNEQPNRSSSPRFMKPNVLNHEISTNCVRAAPIANCRCSSSEGCSDLIHADRVISHHEQKGNSRTACSAEQREVKDCLSSSCFTSAELGAIPKHQDCWTSVVEKIAKPEQETFTSVESLGLKMQSSAGQQLVVTEKPTTLDVPPHLLCRKYAMAAKETGNDSSSSSPDIDTILTKTLMTSRCEPLSPQEMEVYLSSLYRRHMRKAKSISSAGRTEDSDTISEVKAVREVGIDGQLKAKSNGPCVETEVFPCKNVGYYTPNNGRLGPSEAKLLLADILRNEMPKSDVGIDRVVGKKLDIVHSLERCYIDQTDSMVDKDCEESDSVFVEGSAPTSTTTRNINRKLFSADPPDEPVFIVGNDSITDLSDSLCHSDQSAQVISADKSEVTKSTLAFHKSASCPNKKAFGSAASFHKAGSLLKNMLKKDVPPTVVHEVSESRPAPTLHEAVAFRNSMQKSANMVFHTATGLPLQSSPAPIKRLPSSNFEYDSSLTTVRAITNSFSCVNLNNAEVENDSPVITARRTYSTSAPASTNCLLGNFEESMLNGRIEPSGVVEGFSVDLSASGSFCPKRVSLPVTAFFFCLSDDNAPSPYLGHISLDGLPKHGYHVPRKGTLQLTLFNPNKSVVKIFVIIYDLSDMPPNSQSFLRQRTLYMPVKGGPSDKANVMVYLRYLIHLRFASSKSGKIYLHTDIRVIFARDKFELDSRVANYELRSFTDVPANPKYSPKR